MSKQYYPTPADIRAQVESHMVAAGWDKDPPWVKRSKDGRFSESGGGSSSSAANAAKESYREKRSNEVAETEHKKASRSIEKYGQLAAGVGLAVLGAAILKKTGVKQIKALAQDGAKIKEFREGMQALTADHKIPESVVWDKKKADEVKASVEAAMAEFETEHNLAIAKAQTHLKNAEDLRKKGAPGSAKKLELHAQSLVNEAKFLAQRVQTQKGKLLVIETGQSSAKAILGDAAKDVAVAGATLAAVGASFGAATRLTQEGLGSDN